MASCSGAMLVFGGVSIFLPRPHRSKRDTDPSIAQSPGNCRSKAYSLAKFGQQRTISTKWYSTLLMEKRFQRLY